MVQSGGASAGRGLSPQLVGALATVARAAEALRRLVAPPERGAAAIRERLLIAPLERAAARAGVPVPVYHVAISDPFLSAMAARAQDEQSALAAAQPLARRVSFRFRDPQAQQVVRKRIAQRGERRVYAELQHRLAGEIVVAFAEIGRGRRVCTHNGRRCVMDPSELFVQELDGHLVNRARNRLIDSLLLEEKWDDRLVFRDDRLVSVEPNLLEEPGTLRDDDDDTGTVAGIGVNVASDAERRGLLVVEGVAASPVHLRARELELARILAPKGQRLTAEERAAWLTDPAVRAGLAKALGCSGNALRVYLCRLRAAHDAL
jgi:hypothetical protein